MPDQLLRARSFGSCPQLKSRLARNPAHRGHHIAVAIALALATLLALVFPFVNSGSQASQEGAAPPVIITADGLTYILDLDSEAETVMGALAEAGIAIGPEDSILRNGVVVDPSSPLLPASSLVSSAPKDDLGRAAASPVLLSLRRAVPFTIHAAGFSVSAQSSAATVAEALAEAGIDQGPGLLVLPDPNSPIYAGLHIYVYWADMVSLLLGKENLTIYTIADTVADLLAQRGIAADGQHRVSPSSDTPIRSGMTITVTLVETKPEVVEEIIPRQVAYRDDPNHDIGYSSVIEPGSDGYVRREYEVAYENGDEVGRKLLSEQVVSPTDRVIVRGTGVVQNTLLLPDGTTITYSRTMSVYATWYNAASSGGDGITATGVPLDKGIVAVDPRVIPLGTRMYVPGYGYAVAADTGGAVVGYIIDLAYPGSTVGTCCSGRMTIYILD